MKKSLQSEQFAKNAEISSKSSEDINYLYL